ncbi:MAG: hypothetical protein V4592_21300 [Bacteroidota bacterium]
MSTYIAPKKNWFILYTLIPLILLWVTACFVVFPKPTLIAVSVVNIGMVIYLMFRPAVKQIDIDQYQISVLKVNMLGASKTGNYLLNDITFTFRDTSLGRNGDRGYVLTVYHQDQPIFALIPNAMGWADSVIMEITVEIKTAGAKQVLNPADNDDAII